MTSSTRQVAGAGALAAVAVAVLMLTTQLAGTAAPPAETFAAFDPGPVTRWGLPVVRFSGTAASLLTVGALLGVLMLQQRAGGRADTARRLRRWAGQFAIATAAARSAQVVLVISAAVGRPVTDITAFQFLACLGLTSIVYCLVGVAAALVLAALAQTRLPSERLLLVALVVTAAPFMGGHSGSAPNHLVSQALIVTHVLASALWVGGLGTLVLVGLVGRDLASIWVVLPAFSRLALACAALTVLSGIGSAVVRVPPVGYTVTYLTLLGVKLLLFVALVGCGLLHRRMLGRGAAGTERTGASGPVDAEDRRFLRRAFAEVTLMVTVLAVATVLSQTSPAGLA